MDCVFVYASTHPVRLASNRQPAELRLSVHVDWSRIMGTRTGVNNVYNRIQRITTNLWFDNEAEGAAKFYTSIFDNSRITRVVRYGHERDERGSEGAVMTVEFELEGQKYVALNGSPQRGFTEAISFIVSCETQEEIDYYWEKLSDGGEAQVGGWLKDKFGVS